MHPLPLTLSLLALAAGRALAADGVYALSVAHLTVAPTSTPGNVDYEIITKALAQASIVRFYSRPKPAR